MKRPEGKKQIPHHRLPKAGNQVRDDKAGTDGRQDRRGDRGEIWSIVWAMHFHVLVIGDRRGQAEDVLA
jgi:hypothetical protein